MSYTIHFLLVLVYLATRLSYPNPSPCLLTALFVLSPSSPQHNSTPVSTKLSLASFITSRHSRFTSLHLPLLVAILALCGDIHTNPGLPASPSFFLCTYNIRSLLSNDHISALHDLIKTHHPNIIALTETWINKSSTPSELGMLTGTRESRVV